MCICMEYFVVVVCFGIGVSNIINSSVSFPSEVLSFSGAGNFLGGSFILVLRETKKYSRKQIYIQASIFIYIFVCIK